MSGIQKRKRLLFRIITVCLVFIAFSSISQTLRFEKVIKSIIYKQGEEYYLILHESFYQAKSESYAQGNTRSSGYNTSRISVFSIKTGKIVAQKVMGAMDSLENCLMLGCTNDNLWLFSCKYKSGLQSLSPITLERKVSQAHIYSNLKTSIGRLADPDWQELDKYYGFDPIQQKLIVSNELNQKFYLDPENFSIEKITENINIKFQWIQYFKSSALINDSVWSLDGFDKMVLINNIKDSSKPELLSGKFLMEQNPRQLFLHYVQLQEDLTNQLFGFKRGTLPEKDLESKNQLELKLSNAKRNITTILKGIKPDDVLLQPAKESFFVWSKNEDNDQSVVRISKITSLSYGKFSVDWETQISGMFFNVATARYSKEFKQYFGDNIPESESIQVELVNQQLIVIYLNRVCCIDSETGVINWEFSLK